MISTFRKYCGKNCFRLKRKYTFNFHYSICVRDVKITFISIYIFFSLNVLPLSQKRESPTSDVLFNHAISIC